MAYKKRFTPKETTEAGANWNPDTLPTPTAEQNAIIAHLNLPTNLLVSANAGSGKTTTFKQVVKSHGIYSDFTVICFATKLRNELTEALPASTNVIGIHQLGKRLCPNLKVENYKYANMAEAILTQQLPPDKSPYAKTLSFTVSDVVKYLQLEFLENTADNVMAIMRKYDIMPPEVYMNLVNSTIATVWTQTNLAIAKEMSFEDMLYYPVLTGQRAILTKFVLIDECQDLSKVSILLLQQCSNSSKVIAVGDPLQSIMGFAGADSNAWESLKQGFNMDVLPLSVCWRCPDNHLAIVKNHCPGIVGTGKNGVIETLPYEDFLNQVQDAPCLILCRNNAPLFTVAIRFLKLGIKFKVEGKEIFSQLAGLAWGVLTHTQKPFSELSEACNDYYAHYCTKCKDADKLQLMKDKLEVIGQLLEFCKSTTLKDFQAEVRALEPKGKADITLSTVHRAKGLESDRVYILNPDLLLGGVEEPNDSSNQDANLHLVAYTRSKYYLATVAVPKVNL